MDPHALGQLCLDRRLLTEAQLEQFLEIQREGAEWRHLGQILLEHGVLTGVTLANLLSVQARLRGEAPGGAAKTEAAPAAPEPAATELDWLLSEARDKGALGLVLAADQPPAFRLPDGTQSIDGPPLREQQMQRMIAEAVPQGILQRLHDEGTVATTLELAGLPHVRIVMYRHRNGIAVSLKTTMPEVRKLNDLGLPKRIRDLTRHTSGLVLVTGPSGCGKSTTLASLLDAINQRRACHMLLIEDPRELRIEPGKALFTRREVGTDVPDVESALRSAPGADVDVVFVDEITTPTAMAMVLDLAQSGRLVLAGMRTPGAQSTVGRVLDLFRHRDVPFARDALANCLRGILSQRLFPARKEHPNIAAGELLLPAPGVVSVIREGRVGQIDTLLRTGGAEGMISLEESLAQLVKRGLIRVGQAVAAANDVPGLRRILGETVHAAT